MSKENLIKEYTMEKVFNKKTKRYNTIKTALKNGILNEPDNFELPMNRVFVKTGKGFALVSAQKAPKYIKKEEDLLPVNKSYIVNPKTEKIVKKNKKNVNVINKYKKDVKIALDKVSEIKNPTLTKLKRVLKEYKNQNVVVQYIVKGETKIYKEYQLGNIGKKEWDDISYDFIVDSDYSVFTQHDGYVLVYKTFGILTNKIIKQKFQEGITNCLLTPIKDWISSMIENGKSKATKAKYRKKMKIINSMMEKYLEGVPEDDIDYICNELQIDINIDLPFNINQFISSKSTKKALHKFNYINTRLNHIDNAIVSNDNVEYVSQEFLNKKYKELKKSKNYFTYTRTDNGIGCIKTIDKFWTIENDFSKVCNDFERETGLEFCKIDDVKQKELSYFVRCGTHYNSTIDFKEIWGEEEVFDYEENEYVIEDVCKLNWEDYTHIDMEKAYANFHKNTWYEGFLGKITDFRKTDKIEGVGIYQIYDLDFSDTNEKFVKYNEKMNIYINDGIYPTPDLKFLDSVDVKYKIKGGCWGVKPLDFRFNDTMINEKDNGIRYYCKYAGKCDSHRLINSFRVKGNEEYANILHQYANEDTKVHYDNYENEIVVHYPKLHNYHLGHITAFFTSYQRTSTLEQLLELDYDKVVRVCVDGIYFEEHDYTLKNVFRTDKKGTFNNQADDTYISNNEDLIDFDFNESRKHFKKELHLGCGGCGKTHQNLTDKGLVKALFVAPSWKLATDKKNNYNVDVSVWARILPDEKDKIDPEKLNYIKKYANVLIIDEVSMMTEGQKQKIFELYDDMKIIMCGDLGFQLPPIDGDEMTKKGFNYIKNNYGESRRFKCEDLKELCNKLRKMIDKKCIREEINEYVYNYFINKNKVIESDNIDYNVEDMILTGTNIHKNYFTEKYRKVGNKWYITENNRLYQNGCIVIGDKPFNTRCEERHAFTTHSIQGETAENNLFIDISRMFDARMFYTAISRARYLNQIKLIKPTKVMREWCFKKQKEKSNK